MLQSRLNAAKGPTAHLCPDYFLIDQTCEQAKQFGIAHCKADPELPGAFLMVKKNSGYVSPESFQRIDKVRPETKVAFGRDVVDGRRSLMF